MIIHDNYLAQDLTKINPSNIYIYCQWNHVCTDLLVILSNKYYISMQVHVNLPHFKKWLHGVSKYVSFIPSLTTFLFRAVQFGFCVYLCVHIAIL